jgi:hypothetical protein
MDIFKRSDSLHNNNFKRSMSLFHDKSGSGSSAGTGENADHMVFVKFFKHYRCYDLIPVSAKLIVLDTQLIVKKAFHALVSNGNVLSHQILFHPVICSRASHMCLISLNLLSLSSSASHVLVRHWHARTTSHDVT